MADETATAAPIKLSRFRPVHRSLTEGERATHDAIKDTAATLEALIETLPPSREKALALTELEVSVMWAIKALTA